MQVNTDSSHDIQQATIRGIAWNVVSRTGRITIRFGIGIILARLLSPREFGLVAMVTVITNFANIFAELGFSAALIQKKDINPEHLSSVFWLNLGAGFFLMMLFMAGSPLVAIFYEEPVLIPLTMLISTNFLISALNIVQNTLLTKSLDFRTLSIVEISAVGISGTVAVIMAYTGFGVWSLAVQSVILSSVTAILLWKFSNWYPSFTFKWHAVQDLLGFSMNLFGTQLLNYWVRNIDYVLIGKFLGTNPLGVYNRAYDLMLFPLNNVSRVLSRVMFPSFSIIQEDKKRVKNIFLKVTRTIALVTFPLMLGLFVTVDVFVITLYGTKWVEMIPILRILCLVGLMQSIGTLNGNLYLSQGRADLQFRVSLVVKIIGITGIVIGLKWGIIGVAIGYAITSVINAYPAFYFAGRLVNLTYWELLKNLAGIFICALFMAILVAGLGLMLPSTFPHWAMLLVQACCGIIIYVFLIHIFKLQAYHEIYHLIRQQLVTKGLIAK